MELTGKSVRYTQEGKRLFDQFYLDEDYNVPESADDVRRVILSCAEVRSEEIRIVENYIRITGKVYYRILCLSASGDPQPETMEGKIPFEEMVYAENTDGESYYIRNTRTEPSVTVVNSRKLGIRIMVELEIGREKIVDEEIILDAQGDAELFRKMKKRNLLTLHVSKKDTYRIKEEAVIPGAGESIGKILFTDICSRKFDVRIGTDELFLRGELLLFCLYLSPDGKTDWMSQTVPYEGRISCEGAEEGMYFYVRHSLEDTLTDVRLDDDGEMRVIGVEATMALRISVYKEEETEMLDDMYALGKECVFRKKQVVYEEMLMQNQSRCRISERLELPELKEDVLQIIHSRGTLQPETVQNTREGIRIEGILHISFLYLKADDIEPLGSWQGMIPFSYLIECADMPEHARAGLSSYIEQLQITLGGTEAAEIRAVLAFDAFVRKPVQADMITEASLREIDASGQENAPGIVGHIVQPGEDLWSLAKKYMTTEEGIREVNKMGSENVKTGDKLLIFRENMSIL